jgi:hypothetical protein
MAFAVLSARDPIAISEGRAAVNVLPHAEHLSLSGR